MQTIWKIDWLKCDNQNKKYNNLVTSAGWSVKVFDENFTSEFSGVCSFAEPNNNNFVNYEQLKELTVLNWCWDAGLNKNEIESFLQNDINFQKFPAVNNVNLPWNN